MVCVASYPRSKIKFYIYIFVFCISWVIAVHFWQMDKRNSNISVNNFYLHQCFSGTFSHGVLPHFLFSISSSFFYSFFSFFHSLFSLSFSLLFLFCSFSFLLLSLLHLPFNLLSFLLLLFLFHSCLFQLFFSSLIILLVLLLCWKPFGILWFQFYKFRQKHWVSVC